MRSAEDYGVDEIMELAYAVLYYVGIHPAKLDQKLDFKIPLHETVGGIRMALRRMQAGEKIQIRMKVDTSGWRGIYGTGDAGETSEAKGVHPQEHRPPEIIPKDGGTDSTDKR